MRHHNATKKLGREKNQRRALLRSLAEALLFKGRITTTTVKAKELRKFVEPIITKGKKDTVAARRLVTTRLGTVKRSNQLYQEVAPKYKERPGGYTRIIKLPRRASDGAPMAIIELV